MVEKTAARRQAKHDALQCPENARKQITGMENRIKGLLKVQNILDERNNKLKNEAQNAKSECNRLRNILQDKDTECNTLRNILQDKENEILSYQKSLNECDVIINSIVTSRNNAIRKLVEVSQFLPPHMPYMYR